MSKLNKLTAKEIHKQVRYPKVWNSITAQYPLQQVQIDLMIMDKLKTKNKGYAYALVLIDIYSRFAEVIPMKSKTSRETLEAFKKIKIHPEIIRSDNGSEFTNQEFQTYLKSKKIKHFTNNIGDHNYLGIVDRFIKTIRDKLRLLWTENDNFDWVSHIAKIVKKYNSTKHSTTKQKPLSILLGKKMNEQTVSRSKLIDKFPVGTRVRKLLKRNQFEKGGQQWSKQIYTVKARTVGYKLLLEDDTTMSPRELQITKLSQTEGKDLKEKLKKITKEKTGKQLVKRELGTDLTKKAIVPLRSKRAPKPKKIFDL